VRYSTATRSVFIEARGEQSATRDWQTRVAIERAFTSPVIIIFVAPFIQAARIKNGMFYGRGVNAPLIPRNQLPLSLLNAAQNKPMVCNPFNLRFITDETFAQLVELKNGETFNGHLVNCDNFMNITLREVYQTSTDGDRFWKVKECYIRGSTVRNAQQGV
jgi:hypothetical protein